MPAIFIIFAWSWPINKAIKVDKNPVIRDIGSQNLICEEPRKRIFVENADENPV